jgi:hypothetical protein
MTPLEVILIIVALVFCLGTAVGRLLIMLLPLMGQRRAAGYREAGPGREGTALDEADAGPAASDGHQRRDPGDRDDGRPWWGEAG